MNLIRFWFGSQFWNTQFRQMICLIQQILELELDLEWTELVDLEQELVQFWVAPPFLLALLVPNSNQFAFVLVLGLVSLLDPEAPDLNLICLVLAQEAKSIIPVYLSHRTFLQSQLASAPAYELLAHRLLLRILSQLTHPASQE